MTKAKKNVAPVASNDKTDQLKLISALRRPDEHLDLLTRIDEAKKIRDMLTK